VGIATILPELHLLIQQYFDIVEYVGSLYAVNKVPYVLDWVHIKEHVRPLKYVNRLLLHEFSYNTNNVQFGVIVHTDRPVSQWMIIKMGYNVCIKYVIAVCNAIQVTL